jgi:uncharacterized membrane protein
MPRLAHFILIDAPIERVFAFVADYHNLPRIQTQFKSVRLLTAAPDGPGAQVEAKGAFHGLPLTVQMTIIESDPPHLLVSHSAGGVQSRSTWSFREQPAEPPGAPAQVRVTLTINYEIHMPGLKLLGGVLQHELDSLTIDSLRRLKLLVEENKTGNQD